MKSRNWLNAHAAKEGVVYVVVETHWKLKLDIGDLMLCVNNTLEDFHGRFLTRRGIIETSGTIIRPLEDCK